MVDPHALGEHGWARELNEQALAMYQRLYEGDHPDVAQTLNNLAVGLRALGEPARARELEEQAQAMRQRLAHGRSAPGSGSPEGARQQEGSAAPALGSCW